MGRIALLALCAFSAGASLSLAAGSDSLADLRAEGPSTVFQSVQAAAVDALTNAYLTATPRDRRRLRAGTIYRVADGFSYTAPQRSGASSPLMRQRVRYALRSIDVASYVVEPRSGEARSTRSNETPIAEQKRIVDDLDPAHRPLYVLTPSLDITHYSSGGKLRMVSSLNERGPAEHVDTSTTAQVTSTQDDVTCAVFGHSDRVARVWHAEPR
jgi:hypothetical protein